MHVFVRCDETVAQHIAFNKKINKSCIKIKTLFFSTLYVTKRKNNTAAVVVLIVDVWKPHYARRKISLSSWWWSNTTPTMATSRYYMVWHINCCCTNAFQDTIDSSTYIEYCSLITMNFFKGVANCNLIS